MEHDTLTFKQWLEGYYTLENPTPQEPQMNSREHLRALQGVPENACKDPPMKVMPPWMWVVLGLSAGALGFAAFSSYLALLAPLILMGLAMAYVAGEQRTAQALKAAEDQRQQELEEAALDEEINAPDEELERKFKALADAEEAQAKKQESEKDAQREMKLLVDQAVQARLEELKRRLRD